MTIAVVGDVLLDRDVHGTARRLSPDAPVPVFDQGSEVVRPGGAGLAAALAVRDGHEVTLVTALAKDAPAQELRGALDRAGVEVLDLGLEGGTPEQIRFFSGAQQLLHVDRGGAGGSVGTPSAGARAAITWAEAVLVVDYGRGVAAEEGVRDVLAEICSSAPVIWDPHPNGLRPVPGVLVATPDEAELNLATGVPGGVRSAGKVADRAAALRRAWGSDAVCVRRGNLGALLTAGDASPLAVPAEPLQGGDPCGAGDRFSSRLTVALAEGRPLPDAVCDAVATASLFVAAGGARAFGEGERSSAPAAPELDAYALARQVRASGGTVVATGGCFDLLHAGHVSTLMAARALGDCLIVCLNSDDAVRRLKGPGRPVVAEEDRAALLQALSCVDAVVTFAGDTPETALGRLRPHVWAKGGDDRSAPIPEARVVEHGGGRIVVLPYIDGRSSTGLIQRAGA